ncbi:uncharacterized protein LOC121180335 [Toxotes jaculatrix]|uniref:uncharacterized protein LOC121180335 n=1 Tax=Toxotes jaculatrix TaxID=941984 RepID=UPI001B3B1A94|nr:uncharacterized protein LOC121180335 [Toxotes jaculatrix]
MKFTEKRAGEDQALGENASKDSIRSHEPSAAVSHSSAAQDAKAEAVMDTDMRETSADKTVTETVGDNNGVNLSEAGKDKAAGAQETKASVSNGRAASMETAMPELPKVTQQMVNALLVECRTRTGSHPNNVEASTCGVKGETQTETEQDKKSAEGTKEAAKSHTEEEEDTPMEVAIETAVSDATATLLKSDQQVSESEPVFRS